jgi:hypothetical protein
MASLQNEQPKWRRNTSKTGCLFATSDKDSPVDVGISAQKLVSFCSGVFIQTKGSLG